MDFEPHREALFAYYLALARDLAWKAYSWARVQELARDPCGLYSDFPERLKAELINPEQENT